MDDCLDAIDLSYPILIDRDVLADARRNPEFLRSKRLEVFEGVLRHNHELDELICHLLPLSAIVTDVSELTAAWVSYGFREYKRVEPEGPTPRIRGMSLKVFCAVGFCLIGMQLKSLGQSPLALGEHQVTVNGVRLWYKVAGREQPGQAPVLFLHGGPGYNSYSFEKTIGAQLEAHMEIIYLDERGSGRSERPADHDYKMTTLVADVEDLREKLGLPQLSLMGHSFGGTIALEYAARYPENVQKLVILDAASDMPKTFSLWKIQIESRYPDAWKQALNGPSGQQLKLAEAKGDTCAEAKAEFNVEMAALQKVNGQDFHNWQQFHDQRYQQQQSALDNASGLRNTGEFGGTYFGPNGEFPCYRFTAFQRLKMPVLVVVGKYDGAIGKEQMKNLATHLQNAQFDEFDRSAHFAYAEQSNKFVDDVTAFLKVAR